MTRRAGAVGPALGAAVALLAILGVLLFHHLQRSSASLAEAIAGAGGAVAEELASSAVEEAVWRLSRAYTDPRDPLFDRLRKDLITGRKASLDLSRELSPQHLLSRLYGVSARPLYRTATLERFRVVMHVPTLKQGGEQLVEFDAGVTLSAGGREVHRRVVQRRRYGVLLVSPPKPFDRTTLAILKHSGVPALQAAVSDLAHRVAEFAHARKQLHLRLGLHAAGEKLDLTGLGPFPPPFVRLGRPPAVNGYDLSSALARLRKAAGTPARGPITWGDWALLENEEEAKAECGMPQVLVTASMLEVKPLPRDIPRAVTASGAIVSSADQADLAEFDYEVRLRDEYESARKAFERTCRSYNDFWMKWIGPAQWPKNETQKMSLLSEWSGHLNGMRPGLVRLAKLLEPITRHANQHGRSGLSEGDLQGYLATSSHRLRTLAYHAETTSDIARAFRDYPGFNAHLSYCGPESATVAAREFRGTAVISARPNTPRETGRALVVDEFAYRDRREDLAVIAADHLDLRGSRVQAGLVARNRLEMRSHPDILGNLTVYELRPLLERGRTEELRGRVAFDPRLSAGAYWIPRKHNEPAPGRGDTVRVKASGTPPPPPDFGLALDHYAVVLCPRDMERALHRSRAPRHPGDTPDPGVTP